MPLFHFQIGFPAAMKFRPVTGLVPTAHATREANTDRYGSFSIPTDFNPATDKVIEIETVNGALHKVVARKQLDENRDVIFVFLPRDKMVKTCWVNDRNDLHNMLDKSRYDRPI